MTSQGRSYHVHKGTHFKYHAISHASRFDAGALRMCVVHDFAHHVLTLLLMVLLSQGIKMSFLCTVVMLSA